VATEGIRGLRRRVEEELAGRLPPGGSARNAAWLFGGQVIGLAVTLVATPIQLEQMGAERYGVVVITAAALNSLLLVDIGAGWAVMRAVPWHRARGDDEHARRLAGSGLVLGLLAACVIGAAVWVFADEITGVFRLSASARPDAEAAFRVLAFTLPLTVTYSIAASVARAAGLFPLVAAMSTFTIVALNVYWAVVAGEPNDVVLVARGQLVIAAIAVTTMLIGVHHGARAYLFPLRASLTAVRELLSFGGKSATGMASLLVLLQADKVALAAVLPVSVLPAYSIPFSIALRITVTSSALGTVLLPRFSALSSLGDAGEMRRVGMRALRVLTIASATLAVTCAFAGGAFLELWVDSDFAQDAWGPLVLLAVGFATLAIGSVGQAMLDATGRPGINAAMTVTGAALGMGLGIGLAAVFETALAAAAGVSAGLCFIGVGALALSRRLVMGIPRRTLLRVVGIPWASLAAAGAAAFAISAALSAPPVATLVLVGLAALGMAAFGQARWARALSAGP
jgi:O-antigen/teichoic acid export membrane protein